MFDIFIVRNWFKKYIYGRDVVYLLLLIIAFLLTRLINLDKFPIFTDEGIYIHWAKIAWKDPNWRFISLTDGKQPLHTWGMIPFLKIFHNNLLLGGRMFSVLSGAFALTGIFLLTYYIFNKRAAFFAALFYIIAPMFIFYDRMALADSAVNAGFIWVLFGSIVLVRTLRLDVALLYGITAGTALLAKSSSQLFLGLSAFAPILMLNIKKKDYKKKIVIYYFLFAISVVIAFVMYNVQRLSPYLHYVAEKNNTFVMSFSEFLHAPFSLVFNNLPIIPYYVASEMGYILAAFGLFGLVWLYRKDHRLALYFTLWIVISYLGIAFMAKVIFPRYLIFFASLLTVTGSFFVSMSSRAKPRDLWRDFSTSLRFARNDNVFPIFLLVIFLLSVIYFDYTILFSPANIPFPGVDRGQYIESFNAGWGVKDIISFAHEKSAEKPIILIAEGNFGVVADMLEASIPYGWPITVKGYWPLNVADLKANQLALNDHYVYIVFSHKEDFSDAGVWPMKFIKKYPKPGNKSNYYLYELTQ